jgi:hypothetical protein
MKIVALLLPLALALLASVAMLSATEQRPPSTQPYDPFDPMR